MADQELTPRAMPRTDAERAERYDVGRFVYSIRPTRTYRRTWPAVLAVVLIVIGRTWQTWGDVASHDDHLIMVSLAWVCIIGMTSNWFIRQTQGLLRHIERERP